MKMTMADLVFYAEFSPPREGEKHGDYTKRRIQAWNEGLVLHDEDDKKSFHGVAGQLYFGKEKKAGAVKLSGADLVRQDIADERARLMAMPVHFSSTFDTHMFKGEPDGNKHKGLHSLIRLLGNQHPPAIEVIVDDRGTGAYSAQARLHNKTDSKASSFFPNAWSEEKVKAMIKEAYLDARLNTSFSRQNASPHGLSWVGRANVNGVEMMIGGMGDGDKPASGIATAFPAVNGEFKDYN
jgi:hypothetical protein